MHENNNLCTKVKFDLALKNSKTGTFGKNAKKNTT